MDHNHQQNAKCMIHRVHLTLICLNALYEWDEFTRKRWRRSGLEKIVFYLRGTRLTAPSAHTMNISVSEQVCSTQSRILSHACTTHTYTHNTHTDTHTHTVAPISQR